MDAKMWWKELPAAVTVCDRDGLILEMNDKALRGHAAEGGAALIGTNVLDCHPEPSRTKLRNMLAEGRANVYTIEKRGVKKLIYQAPCFEAGVYTGFVELSIEVPFSLPHFVRG